MTWMLASISSVAEADIVIRAGVDLIDLKQPQEGALGALPLAEVEAIAQRVQRRHRISATIGDLPADPHAVATAVERLIPLGIDYIKVGFFSDEHLSACLPVIAELAAKQAIIAVLFADRTTRDADLSRFAAAGCAGVMLDTADKTTGRLRQQMDEQSLGDFVLRAKGLGLLTGLAGSLRLTDIPILLGLSPDYLGFRGALCREGARSASLDEQRVRVVRQALLGSSAEGDWRPATAYHAG